MKKNLIFDIGGVVTKEEGAKAFVDLEEAEQKKLNKIVFYHTGFHKVLLGNITSREYQEQLQKENPQYAKQIQELLNVNKQEIFDSKDEKMVNLLYELKKKYEIYFLSNMIDITYEYLKDFLDDFDGGAYSFLEHHKKPEAEFFLGLLNKYQLKPEESIFWDDKLRNVLAARKLGMKAIEYRTIDDVLRNI